MLSFQPHFTFLIIFFALLLGIANFGLEWLKLSDPKPLTAVAPKRLCCEQKQNGDSQYILCVRFKCAPLFSVVHSVK